MEEKIKNNKEAIKGQVYSPFSFMPDQILVLKLSIAQSGKVLLSLNLVFKVLMKEILQKFEPIHSLLKVV